MTCRSPRRGPALAQDIPLAVDLAGDRRQVRCYFIPDGREILGIEVTDSARYRKALHLTPFWTGVQQGADALGLVVYRPRDLTGKEVVNLQSHFVFRREADKLWLGGKKAQVPAGSAERPGRLAVEPGEALVSAPTGRQP